MEREKQLVDYRVSQDLKAEEQKAQKRLEAEKAINDVAKKRHEEEKNAMKERARLQAEIDAERERILAPMRLEMKLKKHEATKVRGACLSVESL